MKDCEQQHSNSTILLDHKTIAKKAHIANKPSQFKTSEKSQTKFLINQLRIIFTPLHNVKQPIATENYSNSRITGSSQSYSDHGR